MTRPDPLMAPRPRRADAARSVQSLLAAAKTLFDEHGPDVALDEVARRAGVGNATLYRHFPTRQDLIVAVYADEVTLLCEQGADLLESESAADALFIWLDSFVVHVAAKRALALAGTADSAQRRTTLFDHWHTAMRSTAQKLLTRAQHGGAVDTDLTVDDMLALTNAAALVGSSADHARRLLRLQWRGFAGARALP
ncbi:MULTISPECIES: helix-turn-helix domain-containing protein [Streptomyces]|uniref:Helix-turn-helix domain-containing protein n=1 Tax=Streptomyces lonegramiae TaxID=3075524 RepID=A0ABU2XWB2_9ACTN|nr:helix-turn-helix domain-containing protein [Streptomyces sp. DSM 41529]MDT0549749.1 helix-turn-helix domain-containing protein [Streptomyces sp. DSM 41529]